MEKTQLKRRFILQRGKNETPLADPDPTMTPDGVMTLYANTYPELNTSSVHGPEYRDNPKTGETEAVYTFKTTVGTKG